MPSRKGSQGKKKNDSPDFSLESKLQSLDKGELCDLIQDLMGKSSKNYRLTLEWIKKKEDGRKNAGAGRERMSINDGLLMEYWYNAQSIISEFNEYGGGPEDEEEEAYDWLNKISELVSEGNISSDAKLAFLDDAFEEYDHENSGFEDGMMDLFFEICESKEEWRYLVKKLEKRPSRWRRHQIMEIQKKHLCDDEAYLKIRMNELKYGMDYWDLATFYTDLGDGKKALETAEEGLKKGEGRVTELLKFLSEHYAGIGDTANFERIVRRAMERRSEEREMLARSFEYYRARNDYDNAKKALLKAFDYVKGAGYIPEVRSHVHYNLMKQYLTASDWKDIEPGIIRKIREEDPEDYIRICLDNDMKREALAIISDPPEKNTSFGYRPLSDYNFDGFAQRLKDEFPEEIIEYYWKKAYGYIPNGTRGTYGIAARYLAEAKQIYINVLNKKSAWKRRFSALKEEFRKRRAFLDEVKEL